MIAASLNTLRFIERYREQHGRCPSIGEIGQAVSVNPSAAYEHLERLQDRGLVSRVPHRHRTARLTEAGREMLHPKDPQTQALVERVCELELEVRRLSLRRGE